MSPEVRHSVISLAAGSYSFEAVVKACNTLLQHERAVAQTPHSTSRADHSYTKTPWKGRTFQARTKGSYPRKGRGKGFRKVYYAGETPVDDEENSWDGDDADFQDDDGDYAEQWDEDDDQEEPPPELPNSDEGEEAEWRAWLAFKDARKGVQDERNRRGFSAGKGGKNRPPRTDGK